MLSPMIDLSRFFSLHSGLLRKAPKKHRRFLFERINWSNRLIGITGGRGTGKTTLLLQYLLKQGKRNQDYLYISADHILVEATGLYEIATTFFQGVLRFNFNWVKPIFHGGRYTTPCRSCRYGNIYC